MATFVIKLENLFSETEKLYEQLSSHQEEFDNIINLDFEKITLEIRTFWGSFMDLIGEFVDQQDIYGNQMLSPYLYKYAEITYDNPARIEKIRLLGVNPENLQRARFFIANIPNPFSATTLNLVRNIKEINKSPSQRNLEELFACKREAWEKDSEILSGKTLPKYYYSWNELQKFFIPQPIYSNSGISKAEIRRIQKQLEKGPFYSTELQNNIQQIDNRKQDIIDKADTEIETAESPLDWMQRNLKEVGNAIGVEAENAGKTASTIIEDFLDKFSLGCLIKDALDCIKPKNVTCREIFQNIPPGQFLERIKVAFPNGTETLTQLEKVIEDTLLGSNTSSIRKEIRDLEAWIREDRDLLSSDTIGNAEKQRLREAIQEKTEEIANKKQQISDILKNKSSALGLEEEQMNAFATGGNISSILAAIEGPNALTVTNAIIDAIDIVIPIESICEAITSALSFAAEFPFVDFEGLPGFSLPEPAPLSDPFEGFSFEISEAFVSAITQSLLTMIDGILRDLISCDNLDKFIADIINQDGEEGGIQQSINELFSGKESLSEVIDRNYDAFIEDVSSKAVSRDAIIRIDQEGNRVPIGLDQEGIREVFSSEQEKGIDLEQLAAAAERSALEIAKANTVSSLFQNSVLNSQNNWVIDSTGTKFEIEVGAQVFDLGEIDKFLNNLSDERIEQLSNQGRFTPRALADAAGQAQLEQPEQQQQITNSGKITLDEQQRQEIKKEITCIMQNTVSILPPSQFLSLLAGTASEETEGMAFEVSRLCDAPSVQLIFTTDKAISNMFSSFGRLAGLNNLQNEVQAIIDSPEFQRTTDVTRCGPYDNVEDFKEDLLARVIEPEQATQVMNVVREQRKNRFNELSQQILGLSSGNKISDSINVNSTLISAFRSAKNSQNIEQLDSPSGTNENTKDDAKNRQEQLIANSPILNDMFATVVDTIFLPISSIFRDDMKSLGEGFSDLVEVNEPIPRKISVETGIPLFPSVEIINPEFKNKIDANLIPIIDLDDSSGYAKLIDKSALATDSILPEFVSGILGLNDEQKENVKIIKYLVDDVNGENNPAGLKYRISGEEGSNYTTRGINNAPIPPIQNLVTKRVVGAGAARNSSRYGFDSNITNTSLSFSINGSLLELEDNYLQTINIDPNLKRAIQSQQPSWTISFGEVVQNNRRFSNVNVSSNGTTMTTINGAEPFFVSNLSYSNNIQISEQVNYFLSKRYQNTDKSRKQVFDDIIVRNLLPLVKKTENDERAYNIFARDFENSSQEIYKRVITGFISSLSSGVSGGKLLSPSLVTQSGESITLLESLDFVVCNDIIGIKSVNDQFQEIYRRLPEEKTTLQQRRGEVKRPSRIAKASKIVITKILLKIICLDFILKSLPAFDYFDFAKTLMKNEFLLNTICEFVVFELERIDASTDSIYKNVNLRNFVLQNAIDIVKATPGIEITEEERSQHRQSNFKFNIELKKIVEKYLTELSSECKKIIGIEDGLAEQDDFLKSVVDELKIVDVHDFLFVTVEKERPETVQNGRVEINKTAIIQRDSESAEELGKDSATSEGFSPMNWGNPPPGAVGGPPLPGGDLGLDLEALEAAKEGEVVEIKKQQNNFGVEKFVFTDNSIDREVVLQKFVYMPKVNRQSSIVVNNQNYFTQQKLDLLDSYGIISIEKAKRIINKIYRDLDGKKFDLFICEDERDYNDRFFETPYEVGIRAVLVEKRKNQVISEYGEEIISLNGRAYPLDLSQVLKTKTGRIKENDNSFDVFMLAEERIRINARIPAERFADPNNDLNFKNEFLPRLKNLMLDDTEVNLIFDYSIPLKQLASLFVIHYSLSNNGKKMKYLLEPTKKKVYNIIEYLDNTGNSTLSSNRLREMMEKQSEERENVGNPAGPLDMEALKLFYRTPIQVLKSLSIAIDPNIAITDKVVAALTIAQKVLPLPPEVKSLPIPYLLTSLSLLPAPIFGGAIPYIPPLTSYNIATPIGPIFLGLEPLLWDLPFYAKNNKEKASGEDEEC